MGIIGTILIGLLVGVVARLLHPGKENMGFFMTILLGIAGSFVAGYAGQALGWYQVGETAGFIASVVAAIILLVIYGRLRGPRSPGN
ncbi:MAG TPA: GlsB/YeaQ/YmgE family stress response membrane protein [Candidatus Desulfobacillus sp.]|nr:GlsB/YeaQ/YmgE family stress response membrane protein [Candidatus Desulfobacillus sp.]